MPRKSALPSELRALLADVAALKRQQRAESAPRRAQRHKLAASVTNAGKSLAAARQRLAEWDSRPLMSECRELPSLSRTHWTAASKEAGRVELQQRVAHWSAEVQRRTLDLELFDALHAGPYDGALV